MTRRLEITVSEETWDRLNVARRHEPRASFVKRALESALGDSRGPDRQAPNGGGLGLPTAPASSRASAKPVPSEAKKPLPREQASPGLRSPSGGVRLAAPVPGVRTAREVALERQARLNKAKGS